MLVYAQCTCMEPMQYQTRSAAQKGYNYGSFLLFSFPFFLKKTKSITMVITECRWIRITISKLKNVVCLTDEIKMHSSK